MTSRCLVAWEGASERAGELREIRSRLVDGSSACLSGSLGSWIALLSWFANLEPSDRDPQFLTAAVDYLKSETEQTCNGGSKVFPMLAFLEPWSKLARPSEGYRKEGLPRYLRIQAINNVRNKFAHTPASFDVARDLHRGLRSELAILLSEDPSLRDTAPADDFVSRNWHSVLRGWVDATRVSLTGSDFRQVPASSDLPHFRWQDGDTWSASPFVIVNDAKASLLYRVDQLQEIADAAADDEIEVKGDYYRFAADADPSRLHPIAMQCLACLRQATDQTQVDPASPCPPAASDADAGHAEVTPEDLRRRAEDAFRDRQWRASLDAFDQLALSRDPVCYNDVARSKHGAACWRVANRAEDPDRIEGLERARQLLEQATGHRDPGYRARARYERSKASFHLWRATKDPQVLEDAVHDAGEAARLAYDDRFISWYERLVADRNTLAHDGQAQGPESGGPAEP